jgi:hypothetical protein
LGAPIDQSRTTRTTVASFAPLFAHRVTGITGTIELID